MGFDPLPDLIDIDLALSTSPNIAHEYNVRRRFPLSTYESQFDTWIKLMKGEKYVCLGGELIECEEKILNGEKWQVCSWTIDKIKTKKGYGA